MQPPKVSDLRSRLLWSCVLLLCFYAVGAAVFVQVERENELMTYELNRVLYSDMQGMYSFEHCNDPSFSSLTFCKDQAQFSDLLEDFFNHHGNSVVDKEMWTPLGAVFFLTQLSATIGYGNTAAETDAGRAFTVIFALVGIPVMGYVIFSVSLFYSWACHELCRKLGFSLDTQDRQFLVLSIMAGFLMLVGSGVYHFLEGWSYLEALYFSFVTLTTVGFGDYLPSTQASKVFSIFYIIFGLGNCASVIALIAVRVEKSHMGIDAFVKERLLPPSMRTAAPRSPRQTAAA